MVRNAWTWVVGLMACGSAVPAVDPVASGRSAPRFTRSFLALPGASPDGVMMDYLLYDPRTNAIWVPAGNTGLVDVVDVQTRAIQRIAGFPTQEVERHGKRRSVGPSAATLGPPGTVYVGNRGDSTICAFDENTLSKGACGALDSMPDGVLYIPATQEVWVTTPRDRSVRVLDAGTLALKARLPFEGEPEGFAVDAPHHRFYTNLEDKDQTLAIDLSSRRVVATWQPRCGEDGPHGLRFARDRLVVACSAEVHVLDVTSGTLVGQVAVGDGVDDVDVGGDTVYAGGAKAGSLAIATLGPGGSLVLRETIDTAPGARNGVVASNGEIFLSHGQGSELVVLSPVAK